jgi:hypothetical protein
MFSLLAAIVWWIDRTPGATVAATASLYFLAAVAF